jgi:prevent-host-death family protein
MTKRYSIAEAREDFAGMVEQVEAGDTVELTRGGRPVAKLLPVRDGEAHPGFWEAYEDFRREFDLAELAIDPDSVFAEAGAPSPGRGFSW